MDLLEEKVTLFISVSTEVLAELRAFKSFDEIKASKVMDVLSEIKEVVSNKDSIRKSHTGSLYYFFVGLLTELKYCDDESLKEKVEAYAWTFEYELSRIFREKRVNITESKGPRLY